jgi:predicted double-glycine peptidase
MKVLEFPELRQTYEYDCGANALEAVLAYYGIAVLEAHILKSARTDSRFGTTMRGMTRVLEEYQLEYDARQMNIDDLLHYIDHDIPVIILVQASADEQREYAQDREDGHWVIAIGYDDERIIFEDPYAFTRTYLARRELDERWHAIDEGILVCSLGIAVHGTKRFEPNAVVHMG